MSSGELPQDDINAFASIVNANFGSEAVAPLIERDAVIDGTLRCITRYGHDEFVVADLEAYVAKTYGLGNETSAEIVDTIVWGEAA